MNRITQEAKKGRGPQFVRFTPKLAVRELALDKPTYSVSKPWAALSLISWAILCGRPGARNDPEKGVPIYTTDARRAGNLFLLLELHRESVNKSEKFAEILRMFEDTEGYANAIVGASSNHILKECRSSSISIKFVIEIIRFIARYQSLPKNKRTIESAKCFISTYPELADSFKTLAADTAPSPGVKKLEKVWAKYRASAPYLFALVSDPFFEPSVFRDIETTSDWTKEFCANQERVLQFLGRAARVAKLLKKSGVKKVRFKDFADIKPVQLNVTAFTAKEIAFISAMDPKASISDGKPYKARTLRSKV